MDQTAKPIHEGTTSLRSWMPKRVRIQTGKASFSISSNQARNEARQCMTILSLSVFATVETESFLCLLTEGFLCFFSHFPAKPLADLICFNWSGR